MKIEELKKLRNIETSNNGKLVDVNILNILNILKKEGYRTIDISKLSNVSESTISNWSKTNRANTKSVDILFQNLERKSLNNETTLTQSIDDILSNISIEDIIKHLKKRGFKNITLTTN